MHSDMAMELTTRCPECDTEFSVSLEQLRLRKGYIRCIQCANIFDGFEAVVPAGPPRQTGHGAAARPAVEPQLPRSAVQPPAPEPGASQPAYDPFTISDTAPPSAPREPQLPSVLRGREDIRGGLPPPAGPAFTISEPSQPHADSAPTIGQSVSTEASAAGPRIYIGEPPKVTESVSDDDVAPNGDYLFVEPRARRDGAGNRPEFFGDVRPRSRWLTLVWVVLIAAAIALLLAQGVYVYRAQLANAFPPLRPSLEAACAPLSCTVPYERRIDSIVITGSALRSTAAPQNDVSTLTLEVTLRNTYNRPQEWPTLVLDLKDASGTVVVRRNLVPAVWVPAELRERPFAAGHEITVQVPVSVRGLQANGYQLDKFFP